MNAQKKNYILLTLFSFVKPLPIHSSTPTGASTEHQFAASTKGSLIMFTVNVLVALMLRHVSLGRVGEWENAMLMRGGLCDTTLK